MKDTAIIVDNVSMMFNLSSEQVDSIKEYIIRMIKGTLRFEEFWALKHISFEVTKGDRVAIVGLNGSGKSTLLKVISGVLKPTEGKVTTRGTIAPLIELGAGFDLDLSAKENIFLNGAILGYSKNEMQSKYDKIIEFSELKKFENVAVKNFSSGMIARLGFAIATCHVPDILIVDEILSVGDFEYQKKCHEKINEMTDNGATVLFVSHSADAVKKLCGKAIWLQKGEIVGIGKVDYIMEKYLSQT
jgi:ABC-2 type transport system ATP-binding protein